MFLWVAAVAIAVAAAAADVAAVFMLLLLRLSASYYHHQWQLLAVLYICSCLRRFFLFHFSFKFWQRIVWGLKVRGLLTMKFTLPKSFHFIKNVAVWVCDMCVCVCG